MRKSLCLTLILVSPLDWFEELFIILTYHLSGGCFQLSTVVAKINAANTTPSKFAFSSTTYNNAWAEVIDKRQELVN